MNANRWSIANYNAALREIRSRTGADLATARETYRQLRQQVGEPIGRNDVRRAAHTKDHAHSLSKAHTAARRTQARESIRTGTAQAQADRITDLRSWQRWIDAYDDLEWADYLSSLNPIETGKKKGK